MRNWQKKLWVALDEKFGVRDVGCNLHIMEQQYDYKMVEQTHKIHAVAKELEHMFVILQFMVDYVVAKLSPSG